MALFPFDWHRAFQDPMELAAGRMAPYWATVPHLHHLDIGNETGQVENDRQKFAVHVDVSQFRPEELNIHVDGRTLTVEGHHEERSDRHGTIERSFKRSYLLPEDCDLEGVHSSLESDGKLDIEAPKKGARSVHSRAIPIEKKAAIKDVPAKGAQENH